MTEVKSWILGMGSAAKVIEPENLKKEIQKESKQILKIYE